MASDPKTTGTTTADESTGASAASSPTHDLSSAICYRMEPSKALSSEGGCQHAGQASCQAGVEGNQMPPCLLCDQSHTVVDLHGVHRIALMITPKAEGTAADQAWEAISTMRAILRQQPVEMTATSQTVFLRSAEDEQVCRKLFEAYFGEKTPVTNYIVQPPCGGQALAIEAWAVGGEPVEVEFLDEKVVAISYDGLRFVHLSGITPEQVGATAFEQSKASFDEVARRLDSAGTRFNDVVRAWLYMGGITEPENGVERYRELNRARTDFFADQEARGLYQIHRNGANFYPACTGIGMVGRGLVVSCMTLQTDRDDVRLLPLENPNQTSAFEYSERFSPKSPKFSRAMAVVLGDYVTTWISGTASIVDSETVHLGDIEKQTEQTIDNIRDLISRDNFERHGVPRAGAELGDLAKVRVYIKHPEDYEACRAVCERRFGPLPTIYAVADVCRPDLLVEIEGVAFSRMRGSAGEPTT